MIIKQEEKKYFEDDIQLGYIVDWKKAFKYFNALGVPENVWTPCHINMNNADWFVLLSKRSRGKTTNLLLIGMILNQMYSSVIGYIRTDDTELTKMYIDEMFKVIDQYDYISELTDGRWNGYYYYAKKFYWANFDEEGKRTETSQKPFMKCFPICMSEKTKSTLNEPDVIMTIFDEFMKTRYVNDEFISLTQVLSSIRRDRWNLKCFMPSNLVSPYNQYLEEMDIRDTVLNLGDGQIVYLNASFGARMYVEHISVVQAVKNETIAARIRRMNEKTKEFFGFKNPKLKSIVGGGWQISNYPHLPRPLEDEKRELLYRDVYIKFFDKTVCLELCYSNVRGFYINARMYFDLIRDNVFVFTLDPPKNPREFYGFGMYSNNKLCHLIWKTYQDNKFFYATNEVGRIVEEFVNKYRAERHILR